MARPKDPTRPIPRAHGSRLIFLRANPGPPWLCFYCGDEVVKRGTERDSLHVHHLDGDNQNNKLSNLVPTHQVCHHRHHRLGVPMSEAVKTKIAVHHYNDPRISIWLKKAWERGDFDQRKKR